MHKLWIGLIFIFQHNQLFWANQNTLQPFSGRVSNKKKMRTIQAFFVFDYLRSNFPWMHSNNPNKSTHRSSWPPSGWSPRSQSPSRCSCSSTPSDEHPEINHIRAAVLISLKNLDDVVRLLGHEGKLHDGGGELLHGHGGLTLHQDNTPRNWTLSVEIWVVEVA